MSEVDENIKYDIGAIYKFMLESEDFRNGLHSSEKLRILRMSSKKHRSIKVDQRMDESEIQELEMTE